LPLDTSRLRHRSGYLKEHLGGGFPRGTTFLSGFQDAATQLHDPYCSFRMKPVISTHSSVQSPGSQPWSMVSYVIGSSVHHTLLISSKHFPDDPDHGISSSAESRTQRADLVHDHTRTRPIFPQACP
jgi:hypothetical protein